MRPPVQTPHSNSDQPAARCCFPTTARICNQCYKVILLLKVLLTSRNHELKHSWQSNNEGNLDASPARFTPLLL